MAIFRLSAQIIGRSKGRSAIAAAAYRAGEKLVDQETGQVHDFSRKRVAHREILAPPGAPAWATDRESLWNAVHAVERRADAQLARELQLALPNELSSDEQVRLVRQYLEEVFVSQGMIADFAIHPEPGNVHAHVMLTLREVNEAGFGQKVREWNGVAQLCVWRAEWADHANRALAREGHEVRIDHRSLADQGIPLEPRPTLPRSPREMIATTLRDDPSLEKAASWAVKRYLATARRNGLRLHFFPSIAYGILAREAPVFSDEAITKLAHANSADADQFQALRTRLLNHRSLIQVGVDAQGRALYTTKRLARQGEKFLATAAKLDKSRAHGVAARHVVAAASKKTLNAEQARALDWLTLRTGGLALLEGHAGTGKSYMLDAAREAWEAAGYTVVGGALAGKAAAGLEESAGITSRTLAAWELAWDKGQHLLNKNTVLVVDEAGMVGTEQMHRLIQRVQKAGAKLVLVGDSQQLQPIDAGAPFRALGERFGHARMAEIQRQKGSPWQTQASLDFAAGATSRALEAYEKHGRVGSHKTHDDAVAGVIESWWADRVRDPNASQLMMAYRRADVLRLNEMARDRLKEAGFLQEGRYFDSTSGPLELSFGDRLVFLRNDKATGVMNGTTGELVGLTEDARLLVKIDSGKLVTIDPATYKDFAHGYATTVHKAQGVTVDRAYVLADALWDRHAAYVGMTRHRKEASFHWAEEDFGTRERMLSTIGRPAERVMTFDQAEEFTPRPAAAQISDVAELAAKVERFIAMPLEDQEAYLEKRERIVRRDPESITAVVAARLAEAQLAEKGPVSALAIAQKAATEQKLAELAMREARTELEAMRPVYEKARLEWFTAHTSEERSRILQNLQKTASRPVTVEAAIDRVRDVRKAAENLRNARAQLVAARESGERDRIARAAANLRVAQSKLADTRASDAVQLQAQRLLPRLERDVELAREKLKAFEVQHHALELDRLRALPREERLEYMAKLRIEANRIRTLDDAYQVIPAIRDQVARVQDLAIRGPSAELRDARERLENLRQHHAHEASAIAQGQHQAQVRAQRLLEHLEPHFADMEAQHFLALPFAEKEAEIKRLEALAARVPSRDGCVEAVREVRAQVEALERLRQSGALRADLEGAELALENLRRSPAVLAQAEQIYQSRLRDARDSERALELRKPIWEFALIHDLANAPRDERARREARTRAAAERPPSLEKAVAALPEARALYESLKAARDEAAAAAKERSPAFPILKARALELKTRYEQLLQSPDLQAKALPIFEGQKRAQARAQAELRLHPLVRQAVTRRSAISSLLEAQSAKGQDMRLCSIEDLRGELEFRALAELPNAKVAIFRTSAGEHVALDATELRPRWTRGRSYKGLDVLLARDLDRTRAQSR